MKELTYQGLNDLILDLRSREYRVIGPRYEQGSIMLGEIDDVSDLPRGWHDVQSPGSYRLQQSDSDGYFSHTVGPLAWKRFLFPPHSSIVTSTRGKTSRTISCSPPPPAETPDRTAFIGIRPCDLAALSCLDAVFFNGAYQDRTYRDRRRGLFIVAANCMRPSETCFCSSMGTGPKAFSGFDLCLTEIESKPALFLCETGSSLGSDLLHRLNLPDPSPDRVDHADALLREAAAGMHRSIATERLPEFIAGSYDNLHWADVGTRCLTCANCTMVCPTCFCSTIDDVTDLTGGNARRVRRWDSCFTLEFSRIHGGNVRQSPSARYRQWLTHKFGWWKNQFGTFGCVGCGRCITWCPVGIDVTHEIERLQEHSPISPIVEDGD